MSTGEVAICLRRRRTSRELLLRVGKLSLNQVQLGLTSLVFNGAKSDSPVRTDNQKECDTLGVRDANSLAIFYSLGIQGIGAL